MRDIPTISRQVVTPIIQTFADLGADVDALLESADLTRDWLDETLDELSETAIWHMFERCDHQLGTPAIGLIAGSRFAVKDLGEFGVELEQSLTLYRCLEHYIRTVNRYSSHAQFWLEWQSAGCWFHRQGIAVIDVGLEQVEQFTIQLMTRIVQLAFGSAWVPQRIHLQSYTDQPFKECGQQWTEDVQLGSQTTAIWIPAHQLYAPIRYREDSTEIRSIRTAIEIDNVTEGMELRDTAYKLGFSQRSLQRLLAQNGLTWKKLLDQIRLKNAVRLLAETELSQIQISNELGYTDPANYGRAFRRWTGVSPTVYRRITAGKRSFDQ